MIMPPPFTTSLKSLNSITTSAQFNSVSTYWVVLGCNVLESIPLDLGNPMEEGGEIVGFRGDRGHQEALVCQLNT